MTSVFTSSFCQGVGESFARFLQTTMSFYKIEEELKKGGSDIPSLLSLCSTITPTLPITTPKEEGNGVCLFFFAILIYRQ